MGSPRIALVVLFQRILRSPFIRSTRATAGKTVPSFLSICLCLAAASACSNGRQSGSASQATPEPRSASKSTAAPLEAPRKSPLFAQGNGSDAGEEGEPLTRQEAIDDRWDEIREGLDGSKTIEACSSESGNCYTLDADIASGSIDEIHFPNGGYLHFSADIDDDGTASDTDENGNGWDLTIDMNSPFIDEAIDDWAQEHGYAITE